MNDFEVLVKSEIGEDCIIDGIQSRCIFQENSGEYDESGPIARIPTTQTMTDASIFVIRGKEYGVVSYKDDPFGERKIILGGNL